MGGLSSVTTTDPADATAEQIRGVVPPTVGSAVTVAA